MTACKCFEDQCSYVYCNFRLWMDDRIEDVCEVANSIIGCQFKWGQHLNGLGIVEWGFKSVFEEDKVEFVYLCKGRMKVKLTTLPFFECLCEYQCYFRMAIPNLSEYARAQYFANFKHLCDSEMFGSNSQSNDTIAACFGELMSHSLMAMQGDSCYLRIPI